MEGLAVPFGHDNYGRTRIVIPKLWSAGHGQYRDKWDYNDPNHNNWA